MYLLPGINSKMVQVFLNPNYYGICTVKICSNPILGSHLVSNTIGLRNCLCYIVITKSDGHILHNIAGMNDMFYN